MAAGLMALAAVLAAALPARAQAPEPDLVVRLFIEPAGERLHVLVRVPLVMLQGFGLPVGEQGHLDLAAIDQQRLDQAALAADQELGVLVGGSRLVPEGVAHRISLPEEEAFASAASARAHITGPPLPPSARVLWNQGWFDAWLVYPLHGQAADLALDVGLGSFGELATVMATFVPAEGVTRTFAVHGGHGLLPLDPGGIATAATFLRHGVEHLLGSLDHVLLVACLILPLGLAALGPAIRVVGAFGVAHVLALIAGASGVVPTGAWFAPLIQALLAATIVVAALETVVGAWLRGAWLAPRRWLTAGAFGLIHGLAMALALDAYLQFAGSHAAPALLAFTLGVELGLIALLLVSLPLAHGLRHPRARLAGVVLGSLLLAHIGWHRLLPRLDALRDVAWPEAGELWQLLLLIGLVGGLLALAWTSPSWWRRRAGPELPG